MMKLHTNTLNESDIYTAARHARVDVVGLRRSGSRCRDHALEVHLEGESRRRPNGGSSGKAFASGYAATWDQWGVFLGILFDIDPGMLAGSGPKHAVYDGRHDFQRKTNERFVAPTVGFGVSTNYNVVNGQSYYDPSRTVHRLGRDYWPEDAHGDHRFRFEGIRFDGAIVHRCTKCSAAQIHIH